MRSSWMAVCVVAAGCSAQNDSRYKEMDLLALPATARVLTGPSASAQGPSTRVASTACLPAFDAASAAESLRSSLSASWQNVRVLPSGDRWVVVGDKGGLGVSGTVDPAGPGCAAGELYVNIGVHEIPSGTAGRYVGPRGAVAAARSRMPIVAIPNAAK